MSAQDDGFYHSSFAYVHVGALHVFSLSELWGGVDDAERNGITLDQIGLALSSNWHACACALAFRNIAVLRVLIAEAQP